MEIESYIRKLLQKFIAGNCTEEEKLTLIRFFRDYPEVSADILPNYEVVKPLLPDGTLTDEEHWEILAAIKAGMKRRSQASGKVLHLRKWYWAAAVVVLLFSLGISLRYFLTDPSTDFDPYSQQITLVNEHGEVQVLDPMQVRRINTGSGTAEQNKTTLFFNATSDTGELVYNTLRVPYGKTFRIVLSDGTTVDLNAGTSLTFPVHFVENEPLREVTVVGEAYFDVSRNESHPFIVHTDDMDVKVLGTEFNVSNYPENKTSNVVLIEGAVLLDHPKNFSSFAPVTLTPGEMGTFDREGKRVYKSPVVTGVYTAWLDGELVFRNTTFENILVMLERRYNVKIINHNNELAKKAFSVSFKEDSVEKVLDYFKLFGISYTREKDQIIIH